MIASVTHVGSPRVESSQSSSEVVVEVSMSSAVRRWRRVEVWWRQSPVEESFIFSLSAPRIPSSILHPPLAPLHALGPYWIRIMSSYDLQSIFERFDTGQDVTFVSAHAYGSGHINDTFRVATKLSSARCDGASDAAASNTERYYILQRINHEIFTRPVQVMDNIRRITQHLSKKIQVRGGDPLRETLTLLPIRNDDDSVTNDDASNWFTIVDGNYWRLYNFISEARTYEIGEGSDDNNGGQDHVREAAAAFARFQRDVADIPPPRLHETIPRFGDTSFRFQQFEQALADDIKGRAKGCRKEVEYALARKSDASTLTDMLVNGQISERIAHYDTKINNVLIDNETRRGLCVIDLDTVMPGLAIYDFGDAVRAATALAAEDEADLTKVGFSMEKYKLLADGYLSVAKEFLTGTEIDNLAFAARMVTFTVGLRFLSDHLSGDIYFKTQRDGQNLDRAKTQFKTVADMEKRFDEMKSVVDRYRK